MRKSKSRGKKKKIAPKRTPRPVENPGWLREEPKGKAPKPPVRTQASLLPFTELKWEDFERLCLRLSERGANVEAAWSYGKSGHAQLGIDVLVRTPDGTFQVWQSKRYKSISKSAVIEAVRFFLKHKWSKQAARFVLAVACVFKSPGVVEAIEEARTALRAKNIEFEALDASKLTERLRTEPELVDDFFQRSWVEVICPPEALERLKNRLSRFDVVSLRERLKSFYTSWISAVDPGLPIGGQDAQGRTQATIPLTERYIQPDLLFRVAESEIPPGGDNPVETVESKREAAESGKREQQPSPGSDAQPLQATVRERRVPLDEYLSSRTQALIVGEAGSGKTSLLRFLALDILSEQPVLKVAKERFKSAIPVWLPFALWVRMSVERDTPAPIEDVIFEFFRAQGEAGLADDMRRAVLGKGIVLLVDGLDEATNATAAQTLVAVLTVFVNRSGIPVFATSRPHGARNLSRIGGSWDWSDLAALSDEQRHALARLWFGVLESFEAGSSATQSQIKSRANRKAAAFISALQVNAGITRLSQTPLFLLAFMSLHRRGQNLPRNRFAASQEIVDQLIEHQPRRRDVSALSTRSSSDEPRLRDRVIADFAFALQSGDLRGSIPDAAAQEEAVARAARLIRERQQSADQDSADAAARAIFSFTEERAGLLVHKALSNVGFLHLSLQEYLAARHLMQGSLAEKTSFVSANAGRARWREPILFLLFLTAAEAEVGQLLEAIEKAPVTDVQARAVRDALLTEAVFADFAHDLGVVRRLAAAAFNETELTAWGARQRDLLNATVDGLFSESIGGMCRAKLAEWVPDRHGYGRAAAVEATLAWKASLRPASIPALLRCLRCENEYVWRKAAEVLPAVADGSDEIKERLMQLAREAPSVQTGQAAIVSLGCGWSQNEDVGAIARALRTSDHRGLCLDAIRILAKRSETNGMDLDRYFAIAFSRDHFGRSLIARDLAEHFATRHPEVFIAKLEAAVARQTGDRIGRVIPLIGSLFICDSHNALARKELLQALHHDWILHDLFTPGHFPVDRVDWTPELTAQIERLINAKDRFIANDLYWISKVAALPLLKQKFLEALRERQHLSFWCSRALAEVWGKTDPDVQAIFTSMLVAEPEAISQVAEELPLVIDDRTACREALLQSMRAKVTRYDFILRGCKNLGITADDEAFVAAALQAGTHKTSPLYRDGWCEGIITAFSAHPKVRNIALAELMRRDGSFGVIASNYPNDEDMCRRILGVLCPLDDKARMTVVESIEAAAPSNSVAQELLSAARQDTEGLVCSKSTMGWVESALARGALPEGDVQWLKEELDAVGPEYQKRRIAAVIGLLLTGNVEQFVQAKRYDGKPLDVEASPDLTRDDIYLRRLLPRWAELTRAFGNEQDVLDRFEISPERTLRVMHAGIPGADRLFVLLMDKVPDARHVHKSDLISVVAEMAPRSKRMRELIASLLLSQFGGRGVADHWAELRAGEIFAEYFRDDLELRGKIIDTFKANPEHTAAAGALAELLLREDDPDVGKLLSDLVQGRRYGIGTHFKLIAALSSPEAFIESVEELLTKNIEPDDWALSYWMPALLRRIRIDDELQEKMYAALCKADSVSLKISLSALLSRGAGPADNLKRYAAEELQKLQQEPIPAIGFDLTSYAHRPLFQVLTELAA
jgi:hypothetical protein